MPRNSPHGPVESSSSRCRKLEAFVSHYFDPIFHFLLSRQMCARAGFSDGRIAAEVQAAVLNTFLLLLPPERKKENALIIFLSVRLVCLRSFAVCLVSFFLSFFLLHLQSDEILLPRSTGSFAYLREKNQSIPEVIRTAGAASLVTVNISSSLCQLEKKNNDKRSLLFPWMKLKF